MKNKPLLLFVTCCAIPLFLAYSALKFDWLPSAVTNHGEFLNEEIKLENWQQNNPKQWVKAALFFYKHMRDNPVLGNQRATS